MDNQIGGVEVQGGISMVESSSIADLNDIPDLEVSESTSLSPLTSSLDHNLIIQEDNVPSTDVNMGIANRWNEANPQTGAIPLPPPLSLDDFSDVGADPVGSIPLDEGPEHGPFLPPQTFNNLFTDSSDIQEESGVETATLAGVCGLKNLGNTCFMAAGLQCLTATPPVMEYFLSMQQNDDKLIPFGSLMANFSSLLSKMWSGRYSVVKPIEFKQTLGAHHSQFKDYRQHDCQEFLALLLDSLHEQMNSAKSSKNCQVSETITTANSVNSNRKIENNMSSISTVVTASNTNDDSMDTYDNSPSSDCQKSPNVTMPGSPKEFEFWEEMISEVNRSMFNEDEETLDSNEIIDTKSTFIFNKMHENSDDNELPIKFAPEPIRLGLDDILLKDAKTSNANFLVTQQECNNEICYDSQKFPKENLRRTALDNSNLTENHDFDNKSLSIKRIKEVNVQKSNSSVNCLSIDLDTECGSGLDKCNVKRMKLEDHEKNHRHNGFDSSDIQCLKTLQNCGNGALAEHDEIEADKYWAKHLRSNRSVIVDTFQGQFKSTVVCAVCKHVSVTYEPFMYLSVPLPHAMERQLNITFIPINNGPSVRCVLSFNKQSRIGKLKEELLKTLGKEDIITNNIVFAEVLENHISKILDDNMLLKCINDTNRSIYAFELTDPPNVSISISENNGDQTSESEICQNGTTTSDDIGPCPICLEETDGDLKKHSNDMCSFIMCEPCIETPSEPRNCPMCNKPAESSSFMKINQIGRPRPVGRILNVPLVMRHDTNEASNNRKETILFGHPHLIRLPSRVKAKDLFEVLKRVVPQEGNYTVHFVDGQGHRCSRCIYTSHCTGCNVPEEGIVEIRTNDTLAIRYTENIPNIEPPIDHISVSKQRPPHPLSLYDCLQAFSQSEMLDEHNPWFCPKCEQNQCATKTLTVHRYPKYLIVYLKRFVFYECISMKLDDKVTFPLVGLSVGQHLYDLYACVCHYGGVSAGHYTAYARNPNTGIWYYYNDEFTNKQKPQEEDFSNAYILFYCRQDVNTKPCNL
ncbi:ubiquitin carboxyl-terminal hydrolase 10-like isoform X2 [Chelonus insularis]|uniref:ubiquitin carboxyl-terminal hydrolase 10-like isoform X2 n=1 Tax=Chelonus insularis TaxID=460826 RepID=UPI00158B1CDD|nr:ubiquitin carboxyl-terminal hydrolase 10-like isoform X2 [Chelonus insularis]